MKTCIAPDMRLNSMSGSQSNQITKSIKEIENSQELRTSRKQSVLPEPPPLISQQSLHKQQRQQQQSVSQSSIMRESFPQQPYGDQNHSSLYHRLSSAHYSMPYISNNNYDCRSAPVIPNGTRGTWHAPNMSSIRLNNCCVNAPLNNSWIHSNGTDISCAANTGESSLLLLSRAYITLL
jgi:hypothetical protein